MEQLKDNITQFYKKRFYEFVLRIIDLIDQLPKEKVAEVIGNQLLRSSTSIIGNYIEGQAASSKKDFTNYLQTSLKSANESKLWLAILRDSKRVKSDTIANHIQELNEIAKILASSILKLKGRR